MATNNHDLLPSLIKHLDRHLIFPLLDFQTGQIPEDASDDEVRAVTQAKYELLKTTNMTDFIGNLKAELEGLEQPPPEFNEKRQKVIARIEQFEKNTSKLTDLLGREDVVDGEHMAPTRNHLAEARHGCAEPLE